MEQVSLYRKYRPSNFDNLVGQDHVKTTLINAIKSGHISHAYLFTGPRGTGKTSTARLIAKAINCTSPLEGYEPCDKCEFCSDINEGRLIDIIEIDAASNRGIDEVRDLREKINFAPTRAKYKIFIIDEVHMMTKEAFNALLKTLEEPPSHAFFILATTEVHKIPETIISRCQRFDFKRISMKALMTRLSFIAQKEQVEASDEALELVSRYVDGGLRDAIGLMEQLTVDNKLTLEHVQEILGITSYSLLEDLLKFLEEKNTEQALKVIHDLYGQGSDLKQFSHDFVSLLRQKLLESVAEANGKTEQILEMITNFQGAQEHLQYSSIPQLPLEIAIIQLGGGARQIPGGGNRQIEEEKTVEEKTEIEENKAEEKPIEEKKEEKAASPAAKIEINFDVLREKWPRVTERIKSPSLRMSLRSASPISGDAHQVTLEFNTNFHRDKVAEHDNRVELESALNEVFGSAIKVVSTVKALEIRPVSEKNTEKEKQENSPDNRFLSQAMEIFGGEIVE